MSFLSWLYARIRSNAPAKSRHRPTGLSGCRPMLECLEDRTVPSTVSSIAANFNGTAIRAGHTLWFSSVFKPKGVGADPVTIRVTDQTISFRAAGTLHTVAVPDSIINLSPSTSAADATTTFDAAQNAWVTNLPSNFKGKGFLSGVGYNAGTKLPGGIKPVTWQGSFSTDTAGVSLNWQWGAAVYTSFGSDPGVKPLDRRTNTYQNSDNAGTPENFKSFVVKGARGGGGSDYTGSYSATAKVTPSVEIVEPSTGSLSGYVYNDVNANGARDGEDIGLGGVIITLYDANGIVVAQTATDESGQYSFTGLTAGDYSIYEEQPAGYDQGTNNLGSLGGSLDYDTFTVALDTGDEGMNYNFGELAGVPNS